MDIDILSEEELPRHLGNIKENNDEQYKIPKKEILNLVNDIFLTNYWCTRKNMINITEDYIVGIEQIKKWSGVFNKISLNDINYIGHSHFGDTIKRKFTKISKYLIEYAKPVYDILNIGNGKISLCGGAIISILNEHSPNDYDLFFHSDSVEEIDDVFNQCLNYLENLNNSQNFVDDLDDVIICDSITYSRSKYIMNVRINTNNFYNNIQFIKRVYKTKEQVLFGFDLAPSRIGYNPKDGFFATICGGMAYSMKSFCLDSSKRSSSFGYRLGKYCFSKNYLVLLPQLQDNLITNDEFDIFDDIFLIKRYDNSFSIVKYSHKKDDYLIHDDNINYLMSEDYNNITFSSNNLQIITELSDVFIDKYMRDNTRLFNNPSFVEHITKNEAKSFLVDKYKEFALSYFVNEDDEKSDDIWEEKTKYYIDITKKCAENIKNNPDKNYYKGWKYLNPGQKDFGQNNPVNSPPSKYYKPLEVGICNDRFQALMDCRKNIDYIFNIPKELFQLICEYWLKYEVDDARNRLFELTNNPNLNK